MHLQRIRLTGQARVQQRRHAQRRRRPQAQRQQLRLRSVQHSIKRRCLIGSHMVKLIRRRVL